MEPITVERVERAIGLLAQGDQEEPHVKARVHHLAEAFTRLLAEIEEYKLVVYCGGAAACLLDCNVLRVLAGSLVPAEKWPKRHDYIIVGGAVILQGKTYVFQRDYIFDVPSRAAEVVLGHSANGLEVWKDRLGRSINTINKEEQ